MWCGDNGTVVMAEWFNVSFLLHESVVIFEVDTLIIMTNVALFAPHVVFTVVVWLVTCLFVICDCDVLRQLFYCSAVTCDII